MIEVKLSCEPGAWRKAKKWVVKIEPQPSTNGRAFSFEGTNLDSVRGELLGHLKAIWGGTLTNDDFSWHYVIGGVDYTAKLNKAKALREKAAQVDAAHKEARLKLAEEMRDAGVTFDVIAEAMGYSATSSVVMFFRQRKLKD